MSERSGPSPDLPKDLIASLDETIGARCWHVSVGGSTLPTFVLACGSKTKRDKPLANPAQPTEFRTFRGTVELLVWCAWRLQHADDVVAGSGQADDALVAGLRGLAGRSIRAWRCSGPAWDLEVRFDDDFSLSVFSTSAVPPAAIAENWELWTPKWRVAAGPGSTLDIESK